MTAEIISVGTELLLGDIVDTNAAYLSRLLAELGISVYRKTTVGDNTERLLGAISAAFRSVDLVITTGGLGPTADDITKIAAAEYFGAELAVDRSVLAGIEAYFTGRGHVMPKNNVRQAEIPVGAKVLENKNGTAPGVIIEKDGKTIILLPGPPAEMESMFKETVYPYLSGFGNWVIESKTLRMCGIGESAMEERISDIMDGQTNPTIAPYAGYSETRIRVTAGAESRCAALALIAPVRDALYGRLGEYIYGEDEDTLESTVIRILREKGLTIACAESCTGGMLTARLTDVPGASEVLKETVVIYSNESKINRLGVPESVIENHGAVSREAAAAMAERIARTSGADVGLSVTGVAGPGGGTQEKPVGLVYFGLYIDGLVYCTESRSSGNRMRVRTRAVVTALDLLWRKLTGRGI